MIDIFTLEECYKGQLIRSNSKIEGISDGDSPCPATHNPGKSGTSNPEITEVQFVPDASTDPKDIASAGILNILLVLLIGMLPPRDVAAEMFDADGKLKPTTELWVALLLHGK